MHEQLRYSVASDSVGVCMMQQHVLSLCFHQSIFNRSDVAATDVSFSKEQPRKSKDCPYL